MVSCPLALINKGWVTCQALKCVKFVYMTKLLTFQGLKRSFCSVFCLPWYSLYYKALGTTLTSDVPWGLSSHSSPSLPQPLWSEFPHGSRRKSGIKSVWGRSIQSQSKTYPGQLCINTLRIEIQSFSCSVLDTGLDSKISQEQTQWFLQCPVLPSASFIGTETTTAYLIIINKVCLQHQCQCQASTEPCFIYEKILVWFGFMILFPLSHIFAAWGTAKLYQSRKSRFEV